MTAALVAAALVAAATAMCSLTAVHRLRRRTTLLLATARDQHAREQLSATAEAAQLRAALNGYVDDVLVVQAAATVVDDALRALAPERGR